MHGDRPCNKRVTKSISWPLTCGNVFDRTLATVRGTAYHLHVGNQLTRGWRDMKLTDETPLEEVRDFFSHDLFATQACGCHIVEASHGHAVTQLDIQPVHRNAMGGVMGGAIFTLADYALAVACNIGENPTVSVSNSIEFLSAAKGERLIATCDVDKSGRSLGFYTIDVTDELGTKVARMTATCFRRA